MSAGAAACLPSQGKIPACGRREVDARTPPWCTGSPLLQSGKGSLKFLSTEPVRDLRPGWKRVGVERNAHRRGPGRQVGWNIRWERNRSRRCEPASVRPDTRVHQLWFPRREPHPRTHHRSATRAGLDGLRSFASSGSTYRHAPWGHRPRNVSLSLGGPGVHFLLTGYNSREFPVDQWIGISKAHSTPMGMSGTGYGGTQGFSKAGEVHPRGEEARIATYKGSEPAMRTDHSRATTQRAQASPRDSQRGPKLAGEAASWA